MAPGQQDPDDSKPKIVEKKPRRVARLGSLSGPSADQGKDEMPTAGTSKGPVATAAVKEELTHGGVKKTRFVPKVPVRRAVKKSVKKEAEEEETKLDSALQSLLKQSQENPSNAFGRKFGFGDSKGRGLPMRVAFGVASGAMGIGKPGMFSGVSAMKGGGGGGSGSGVIGDMKPVFDIPDGAEDQARNIKPGKVKEYRDPVDYDRNYPTTLPLRLPRSGPSEILDDAEFGEAAQKAAFEENVVKPSEELSLKEESDEQRLLFFQLPTSLPLGKLGDGVGGGEGEGGSGNQPLSLSDLPSGLMGKLKIYESGAVKLHLGSVILEAVPGAKCVFHQELAAINAENGTCHFLGDVPQRIVLTPDIDNLLMES